MTPSVLSRIRRKSTSSLASLKTQYTGSSNAFEPDLDAPAVPPLPPLPADSHMTTNGTGARLSQVSHVARVPQAEAAVSAAPLVTECRSKERQAASKRGSEGGRAGQRGKGKMEIPDKVLVRIFQHLALPPSLSIALADPSSPLPLPTAQLPAPAGSSTSHNVTGPGIRALGRCALASRRFNTLASPVLYEHMKYDDGYRHDPFLDMQSGTLRAAKHGLARLFSPPPSSSALRSARSMSAPASASASATGGGNTRKSALLARTRSLAVSYHWHAWCNARNPLPRLPLLSSLIGVLRVNLDPGSRDNGLHVDRKTQTAPRPCALLEKVRAGTIVLHGVSLWATKSAWDHLPRALGEKAGRVVYVISAQRPPSRASKQGAEGGVGQERGVPLHIARQPNYLPAIVTKAGKVTAPIGKGNSNGRGRQWDGDAQEVVLLFQTEYGKAYDLNEGADVDGKEPNGTDTDTNTDIERQAWGWVGGFIKELADVLKRKKGVGRVLLVNVDAIPLPGRASHTTYSGCGQMMAQRLRDLLRPSISSNVNSNINVPRSRQPSAAPEIAMRTMKQYICTDMREGEMDLAAVLPFTQRPEYDYTRPSSTSAGGKVGSARDPLQPRAAMVAAVKGSNGGRTSMKAGNRGDAGTGELEVWYSALECESTSGRGQKARGVRFG